ncbi:hypothetical protein BT69DRAFT_1353941, partial [Atractiella rhizophila]
MAAYIGYCSHGPSPYNNPERTVMGRPIKICQHLEKCSRHDIEGLNLSEICKEMKYTRPRPAPARRLSVQVRQPQASSPQPAASVQPQAPVRLETVSLRQLQVQQPQAPLLQQPRGPVRQSQVPSQHRQVPFQQRQTPVLPQPQRPVGQSQIPLQRSQDGRWRSDQNIRRMLVAYRLWISIC